GFHKHLFHRISHDLHVNRDDHVHPVKLAFATEYRSTFSIDTWYPLPIPSGTPMNPCASTSINGSIMSSAYQRLDASMSVGNEKPLCIARWRPCADAIPSSGMVPTQHANPAARAASSINSASLSPPTLCTLMLTICAAFFCINRSSDVNESADSSAQRGVFRLACSSPASSIAAAASGCSIIIRPN